MMALFNLGYLFIIYLLTVLTSLINNNLIETIIIILLIIVSYLLYYKLVDYIINCMENKIINKLSIKTDKQQQKEVDKLQNIKIFTYIGYTYIMLFITDDQDNLLYRVRMKGNVFQRYTILDLNKQKTGYLFKIRNNYFTKFKDTKVKVIIEKFMGKIKLAFQNEPIVISVNDDYTKIELRFAKEWREIVSKISFSGEGRVLISKIKLSKTSQFATMLFTLAYISRFYYPGNN